STLRSWCAPKGVGMLRRMQQNNMHYRETRRNSLDSDENALANIKNPLKLDAMVSKP
ncbi:unnamed protein product, partial [Bubo scandiacus]